MTGLAAAKVGRLDPEGITQRGYTYRNSQQALPGATVHTGHGCCQDETRPGACTLVGIDPDADEGSAGRAVAIALRCRRWSCPCCAHRLLRRNRARALKGATSPQGRVAFVTLTLPGFPDRARYYAPAAIERHKGGRVVTGRRARAVLSLPDAAESWNRLRLMIRRAWPTAEFYKGTELHESGVAHLHVLVRLPGVAEVAALRWVLSQHEDGDGWAVRAGFGPVVDVQIVKSREEAGEYVSKATSGYASKSADAMPKWTRRGSWSRGWCEWVRPTPIAGFAWQLGHASADFTTEALRASGFAIVDPGRLRVPASPVATGG